MGDQFNWQIEEDALDPALHSSSKRRWLRGLLFWLVAVAIVGSLLASWVITRERGQEDKQQLLAAVQELLDHQQQALVRGDGDLYFSLQENNANLFSAQLLPANQEIVRSGLQATNVEQNGAAIWVNATWEAQGESLQRILFFQWRAGQLKQIATDSNYWGPQLQREEKWGVLTYPSVDDPWTTSIVNFVDNSITDYCAQECEANRLPMTVNVRDDFRETAELNHINIPSPRLLGLTADGTPSSRFWQELERRVQAYITPAKIRFAVLQTPERDNQRPQYFDQLAAQFMAMHPGISIEISYLGLSLGDFSELVQEYDGVSAPPTEALLASGLVHDLTDFVKTDPDFDQGDFYEQIWQGALWHERTWFVPEMAEMQVLYYDKIAYEDAQHPEPSSRWTWDEMGQDVSSIVAEQTQASVLEYGFLDTGMDSMFSYAYNWNSPCSQSVTAYCHSPLHSENVAAALDWYAQMASQAGQMPNLAGQLSDVFSNTQISTMGSAFEDERQAMLLLNFQGSERKAAVWVDSPLNYEFNLLLSPVGVVSFPGSDRFDGITPLWLSGSFISQQSERPLAVWQWLKFLSYQEPPPRYIPARPSVATDMGYWTTLPRPVGDVMRTAFPFARPVTVAEMGMLNWEKVTAVVNGDATPLEAAQQQPTITWFSYDRD